MFDITLIDRDCSREDYLKIRAIMKKVGEWQEWQRNLPRYDQLAERAALAAELSDCTVDGVTGVVESGRDCDCVDFVHSSRHQFSGAFAFEKYRQDAQYWADGPLYVGLCRPDELPGNHSRDLALEAFEDGHAHVVSTVRFDEEGCYA